MKKRIVTIMLSVLLLTTLVPLDTPAKASTNGVTQDQAVSWALGKLNQSIDYDGYPAEQPYQCVDLIYFYYQYLGAPVMGGDAITYSWNDLPSGWQRINYSSGVRAQPGDIAVWQCWEHDHGHVGIVGSADDVAMNVIEQNAFDKTYVTLNWTDYSNATSGRNSTLVCFVRPDFSGSGSGNQPPRGVVDEIYATKTGGIHIRGWAYDPDEPGNNRVKIEVYVGYDVNESGTHTTYTTFTNSVYRPEIGENYGAGDYHGFEMDIDIAERGVQRVFIYAVDTAGGENHRMYAGRPDITADYAKKITLNRTSMSLEAGKTGQLSVTYSPSDTVNKSVTWTSSNTNVATVNSSGVVTGVGAGTATVTATAAGSNVKATCRVTVTGQSTDSYTVSYDANGGTGAPGSQTKTQGTALTLSSAAPTRADASAGSYTVSFDANGGSCGTASLAAARTASYTFRNWNTRADGTGTSYNPGASYTADASATLYAQWNSSVSTAAITLPTPTRNGYVFQGWATSSTATSGAAGSYTPSGDVTLYAVWKENASAPVITAQPESITVAAGAKAVFTVTAEGGELTYQWYVQPKGAEGWDVINSATEAELSFTADAEQTGRRYRCVVTNPYGSATSEEAVLTVTAPAAPVITTQPAAKTAAAGKTVSFTVKAEGDGELAYQWYECKKGTTTWTRIEGATSAKLTFTASSTKNGNTYRCQVTADGGSGESLTSEAAKLTVVTKPKITTHPAAVKTAAGKKVTFKVKATGTGLKYQWYVMKAGTTKWVKMSGKTKATLSFTAKASQNGWKYQCQVKNIAGTVKSKAAKLTVK